VVLGPAESLDTLAPGGGFRVHVLRHRRRADERDRADPTMLDQCVDGAGRAVDHVQDPRRKPRLEKELREACTSEGRAFGRFEDEGVPRHDGKREHPERDHDREVEGRDSGANADRIAIQVLVDARGDVPQGASL